MHAPATFAALALALHAAPEAQRASAREPTAAAVADSAAAVDDTAAVARTHRFGFELDLVQPFIPTVGIIKPKFSWTVWGKPGGLRGDVLFALYIRPHIPHDILETIDEYMAGVGYRQYLWRGLHLEGLVLAGAAWGTNQFDGEDYTTAAVFAEANLGYRFGFWEPGGFRDRAHHTRGFYIAPQFGTIFSLGVADIGPRNGKPDWFLQGNLLVGASF